MCGEYNHEYNQVTTLTWELQLPSEVEVVTGDSKINELELQVNTLEENNTSMEKEIESLKSNKKKLLKKTSTLADQLKKATSSPQSHGRSKSLKPFEQYSESHRRRLKRARAQNCETSLLWLEKEGLCCH